MQQTTIPANLTLNDVQQHFEHWRATRVKQSKIPDMLWSEVKTLIGRYPISQITQALRVNAHQISAGVTTKGGFTFVAANAAVTPVPIVKVKPVPACTDDTKATCTFEIHRANGSTLTISDFPVASLPIVINQFIG